LGCSISSPDISQSNCCQVSDLSTAPKVPNKKKDTLQSIIDKVNERFSGNFTDSDRVIIEGIYQMFMKDSEVQKVPKNMLRTTVPKCSCALCSLTSSVTS